MRHLTLYLKAACVAAILVALGACTTLQDTINTLGTVKDTVVVQPLHKKEVAFIIDGLGAAGSAVTFYRTLPLCPPGHGFEPSDWCHDKGVLANLDKAQNVAVAAADDLWTYYKQHPEGTTVVGSGFTTKFNAAKAALGELQRLVRAYSLAGAEKQ